MKAVMTVLFALALILAPAAFAHSVEEPMQSDATATQSVDVQAQQAEDAADVDVLTALGMEPIFSETNPEAVCHFEPCQISGCPYQYPTCMANGCCC